MAKLSKKATKKATKKAAKKTTYRQQKSGAQSSNGLGILSGPTKPDYSPIVGEVTQINSLFLEALWGDDGPTLRANLMKKEKDDSSLRRLLKDWDIKVDEDVRIMVVNNETGDINTYINDWTKEKFYILVLPAKPRRNVAEPHYEEMQRWTAAYYHAVNDTYGM